MAEERSIVLVLEAFYGGSHKQLLDTILPAIRERWEVILVTLPDKKWHWKSRCGALSLLPLLPPPDVLSKVRLLFTSSVLNLPELIGLRPTLAPAKKIVYFHESQLLYPRQAPKDWDAQFGYAQIVTCLAADSVVFNSEFARRSFLHLVDPFLKLLPDSRPRNVSAEIEPKTRVLYFPLALDLLPPRKEERDPSAPLHIIWPHRWEHDKNPEDFFAALFQLAETGASFRLSVLGHQFNQTPAIFEEAKDQLASHLQHWGSVDTKAAYHAILATGDVVVSTANQETFGVAMLEATQLGCLPLCPSRLVYPELFPSSCLFSTPAQLVRTLRELAARPCLARTRWREHARDVPPRFDWERLRSDYEELFE